MSRFVPNVMIAGQAAASAATTYLYFPVSVPFRFEGFGWQYQTAEANTNNTLDFVITRDIDKDGTFDNASDAIHTNANPNGLLDSAAVGQWLNNKGDAGSSGGAAVAVSPTPVRVDAGETIRVTVVTAGTGTIPAINFAIYGKWLQPLV